jgi:hypothetical protein
LAFGDRTTGERYTLHDGQTVAAIGSEHPWCLVTGWYLLIAGFAIQLGIELSE